MVLYIRVGICKLNTYNIMTDYKNINRYIIFMLCLYIMQVYIFEIQTEKKYN